MVPLQVISQPDTIPGLGRRRSTAGCPFREYPHGTAAYHVRTKEFPEEQLSVYFTARRYGSLDGDETYVSAMGRLAEICREIVDGYVVENILRPLQQTIAIS